MTSVAVFLSEVRKTLHRSPRIDLQGKLGKKSSLAEPIQRVPTHPFIQWPVVGTKVAFFTECAHQMLGLIKRFEC
jgi:hypothetical protein